MNMKQSVYKYEYERVYSLESFHEFCNFYNVSRNIWLCLMRQYPGFNVPLYNYKTLQQKEIYKVSFFYKS